MIATSFLAWQARYLCAELDFSVIANRAVEGPWETWTIEPQENGTNALRSAHGRYLCAEYDFSVTANREAIGAWEQWTPVPQDGEPKVALRSTHGRYLSVQPDGSVVADREAIGPWELFTVTPWWAQHPAHPDPLRGEVRLSDGGRSGLADESGRKLIWGVHAGDLLARLLHGGEAFVDAQLAAIAAAGGHFVRTWSHLWGPWWAERTGECHPTVDGYWQAVGGFARLLQAHRLQWLVSNGDLFRADWSQERRRAFMAALAGQLHDAGGRALVIGVDAGNENASAGHPDPETMARVLDPFLATLAPALVSTTSSDENDLNRYVSRVCTVVDSHHGRWPFTQAIERAWTAGYWDGKAKPFLVSSEPPGVGCQEFPGDNRIGHHVSATANPSDWDDMEAMGVLAAAHFVSRQAYVYLSSPGVISDEPFANYAALELTGRLARRLPADLHAWSVFHGGENRPFSADRLLAVPSDGRARCEHARSGNSYVVLVHGDPGTHHCRAVNGFTGRQVNLKTLDETPVAWQRGETVPVTIKRGCLFIGERR